MVLDVVLCAMLLLSFSMDLPWSASLSSDVVLVAMWLFALLKESEKIQEQHYHMTMI